jgi:hypothetical protein
MFEVSVPDFKSVDLALRKLSVRYSSRLAVGSRLNFLCLVNVCEHPRCQRESAQNQKLHCSM